MNAKATRNRFPLGQHSEGGLAVERPHVIVVDHDQTFLSLMQDLLEEERYRVTTWADGISAYPTIAQAQPDLLLVDIHMQQPEDGMTLLNVVKLDPHTT